ncbi:MAG: hypothetical protein NTX56_19820, partial [Proteobacteria bacterium]|nr:hypothetical protein [Pseudomonadota bacterium]
DFDLWLRLLEAGVAFRDIRLPLYLYRYNECGLSKNYLNISGWELQVLRAYFQRQGRNFLQSSDDSRIWAYWLVKHLLRYEKCHDNKLRAATQSNIALLSAHPLLMTVLSLANRLRVFRLLTMFGTLRGHTTPNSGYTEGSP